MAHRRADVRGLKGGIRAALHERGALAGEGASTLTSQTNNGSREFALGDCIVFLENNRVLGFTNAKLGMVKTVEPDALQVQLDGKDGLVAEEAGPVTVDVNR